MSISVQASNISILVPVEVLDRGALRQGIGTSKSNCRFADTGEYSDLESIVTANSDEKYSSISGVDHEFFGAHPPLNMFDNI